MEVTLPKYEDFSNRDSINTIAAQVRDSIKETRKNITVDQLAEQVQILANCIVSIANNMRNT